MKGKLILLCTMTSLAFTISCKKSENTQNSISIAKDSIDQENTTSNPSVNFDPSQLPNPTADMGVFPYYSLPEWINKKSSYGFDRESDFGKIEFFTGDSFYPLEGKISVHGYSMSDPNDLGRSVWDEYKFVQSFTKHFESLGAKKLFEGKIPQEKIDELNNSKNNKNYFFDFGTAAQDNVVTYGLNKDGKTILMSVTSNSSYGALYIGEAEGFKQTVSIIKADQIEKDLNEKGKSILHINFDTDKASLKSDGVDVVNEIAKVLKANPNLKLEVNGYTDNVGNEKHNLDLSKNRAKTVVTTLSNSGIEKTRLSSNGFGASNFIADNSTEEGKAQNRRVELIKK